MSSIKIIAAPPGVAPQHIREQWIGVQIPLATAEELEENPPSGFRIGHSNNHGHIVVFSKAIEALRAAGKDEAVDFWSKVPVLSFSAYLEFRKDACEVVD